MIDLKYDVRYQNKKTVLSNGILSELSIVQATLSDRGEYICYASNTYGHDHAMIQLQVQEPPNSPTNLHILEIASRSVRIAWSIDIGSITGNNTKFNYIQPISNYILQFKEAEDVWHEHNNRKHLPGDKTSAKISPLKPSVSYHFRVYAENHLGISAPSDILQVQTDSELPGGCPTRVTARALSSDQILVTWSPPDKDQMNGELLGYVVGYRKVTNYSEDFRQHLSINFAFNYTKVGLSGNDGVSDFRLINLEKYSQYLVTVQAYNSKGEGPPSDPIQIQTLEDIPSAPASCACASLTARNIQVTWEPPPKEKQHGTIQGYKIYYETGILNTVQHIDGNINSLGLDGTAGIHESKITTALNAILHGLQPYTNYSIQVSALTRAGEGLPTPNTFCMTEEAVPDAPDGIKSIPSGDSKVIISWQPPRRPNGIVTKYTVYIRVLDKGQESRIIKETLAAKKHYYEVTDLNLRESYEAWVTASTRIGQGESTPVIKLIPSTSTPAAILSFGKNILAPWRMDIKLECISIGHPIPKTEWKTPDFKRYISMK